MVLGYSKKIEPVMKTYRCHSKMLKHSIIGIATEVHVPFLDRPSYIYIGSEDSKFGYCARIANEAKKTIALQPLILLETNELNQIKSGDILQINTNETINILWKRGSNSNCIFVTSNCNCNCFMCPQPPCEEFDDFDKVNMSIFRLLRKNDFDPICFTGGEPTLKKERLLKYLNVVKTVYPHRLVDILSNGQSFANLDYAYEISQACPPKTTFCISLHADTAKMHNFITRTNDGFSKTIYGLQNLARLSCQIEIRYVITKINVDRIKSFAEFVVSNFPFVNHIAYMNLEMTGLSNEHVDKIWIEPSECTEYLAKAVKILNRAQIQVSLYNAPLCMLPEPLWEYAKKSISEWKNIYMPICSECIKKEICCGFFATSSFLSNKLRPFKTN